MYKIMKQSYYKNIIEKEDCQRINSASFFGRGCISIIFLRILIVV